MSYRGKYRGEGDGWDGVVVGEGMEARNGMEVGDFKVFLVLLVSVSVFIHVFLLTFLSFFLSVGAPFSSSSFFLNNLISSSFSS